MANENTAKAIIRLKTLAELTPGTVTATRRLQTASVANTTAAKPTNAPHVARKFKNHIFHGRTTCVNGTFSFTDLVITVAPGDIQLIEFEFVGLEENGIQRDFISKPYVQAVYSRQCVAGEQQTPAGTCLRCGYGFYSMDVPKGQSSCTLCENNAVCLGGNIMYPMQGYYKKVPYGSAVFRCYNQNACLEGSAEALTGTCAAGYQGFMCGSCVNMFYKNAQSQCSRCPSYNTSMIQAALRLLWLTVLIYGISKLNVRVTQTGNHQYDSFLSNLKEIINHCVVLAAISTIKFDWSATLQRILDVQGYIMLLLSRLVAFQCLVAGSEGVHDLDFTPFFKNLLVTVVSPIILIAWFVLVMFVVSLTKGAFNAIRDQLICVIIVILWLLHPDICQAVFASFACIADGTGQSRLFHDLEVVCWEGQHKNFITFVSIPAIIFWVIGIPGYFMYSLRKNQHLHKKIEMKKNLTKLELHEIETYQNRWGVLTSGMQGDYYYWEVLVMVRKMLIIFCIEYLASVAGEVQILATMLVVVVSTMSVVYSKPFDCGTENAFNIFSQAVHLIWLYDGLYYLTGNGKTWMDPESAINWVFIVFISVPSFGFFLLWLAKVKDQILMIVYKTNRTLWKVLTLGMVNQEEFNAKYIENFHQHKGNRANERKGPRPGDFDEIPDASQLETASRHGSVNPFMNSRKSKDALYLQNDGREGELNYELSKNISNISLHEGDDTAIQQKLKEMINLQLQQQVKMNDTQKDLSQLKQSIRSSGPYQHQPQLLKAGPFGDPGNYGTGAYGGGYEAEGTNHVENEIRRLQTMLNQEEGKLPLPGGGDGLYMDKGRSQAAMSYQSQEYEMARMGMPPKHRSQAPGRPGANGGFFGAGQGQFGMDQKLGYDDPMSQASPAYPGGAGLHQSYAPAQQPLEYGGRPGLGVSGQGGGLHGAESSLAKAVNTGLKNRVKAMKAQGRVQAPQRLQVEDGAGQPRVDGLDVDPKAYQGSQAQRAELAAHEEPRALVDEFEGPARQQQYLENPFAQAHAGLDADPPADSDAFLDDDFNPINQLAADQKKNAQAKPQPPADDFQDIQASPVAHQQLLDGQPTPGGNDDVSSETSSIRKRRGASSAILDKIKSKQQSRKGQTTAQRFQNAARTAARGSAKSGER